MPLVYLQQGGSDVLDLSSDGVTDTYESDISFRESKDLQIVRTTGTGSPTITFQISNDGVNWSDWELIDFVFSEQNDIFRICNLKETNFRMSWLSNSSTGTFTANFNL